MSRGGAIELPTPDRDGGGICPSPSDVTALILRARGGDRSASEGFWRNVYGDLRALAGRELASEPADHALQPTALVHEAYLRLVGRDPLPWENRSHFFGAAARAMRRVLVDHARARARLKRGGCRHRTALHESSVAADGLDPDLLELDGALERLAALDPRKAKVVELRFFGGLAVREIAGLLGVAVGTVARDWKISRLWLHRELTGGEAGGS